MVTEIARSALERITGTNLLIPGPLASFSSSLHASLQEEKNACFMGISCATPDHRHRRLLRACRERRRRAAEQRDEVAPFHVEHGDFLPYALLARQPTRALGFPHLSLPYAGWLISGADLNCADSRS